MSNVTQIRIMGNFIRMLVILLVVTLKIEIKLLITNPVVSKY